MLRWHNIMEENSMMGLDEFQSKDTVTDSTTKIEYITALEATKEGICVKNFVIKLGVVPKRAITM
jgi:hypothetical protein